MVSSPMFISRGLIATLAFTQVVSGAERFNEIKVRLNVLVDPFWVENSALIFSLDFDSFLRSATTLSITT